MSTIASAAAADNLVNVIVAAARATVATARETVATARTELNNANITAATKMNIAKTRLACELATQAAKAAATSDAVQTGTVSTYPNSNTERASNNVKNTQNDNAALIEGAKERLVSAEETLTAARQSLQSVLQMQLLLQQQRNTADQQQLLLQQQLNQQQRDAAVAVVEASRISQRQIDELQNRFDELQRTTVAISLHTGTGNIV